MIQKFDEKRQAFYCEMSLAELAKAHDLPSIADCRDQITPDTIESMPYWYGASSVEEASDRLLKGYPEGAAKLANVAQDLTDLPQAKIRRRVLRWSDNGDDLNIDRAMRGDFDRAFRSSRRQYLSGPQTIEIFSNLCADSCYSADEVFWQGAAAAVLTDVLENAGYRVALTATNASACGRGYGTAVRFDYPIKSESDPMSIDALAGVLCAPSTYRCLSLRAHESAPLSNFTGHGSGYWPEVARTLKAKDMWFPETAIVLTPTYSREAAIEEISRVLKLVESAGEGA